MAIPDFQSLMLPLLKLSSDGNAHYIHDAVAQLADEFSLSEEERTKLLPSGVEPIFFNRVGWAKTYLKKSGLLEYPKRGFFKIKDRGYQVLEEDPDKIDMKYLEQFPEYIEFRQTKKTVPPSNGGDIGDLTPEEALDDAYQKIRQDLADDLLSYVINSNSGFFEKLVVELLVKMGYGGTQREAARAVGKSGDEGIDGIIDEDRLGLDSIYIQAKKWQLGTTVGRPEIQKFVGALHGKRAKRGVFITTTTFSKVAEEYVDSIDTKIVLIDGDRLTDLMIDYDIGVSNQTTYHIKTLDTDYFGKEQE